MSTSTTSADPADVALWSVSVFEVRRTIDVLVDPETVVELRVLDTPKGTVSGYYDDPEKLAAMAESMSGGAPAIYLTLNPVDRALLARAANRVRNFAKTTTADGDVVRRRWLLVDFDPVRPSGISSTDSEHAAALARAQSARDWLVSHGVPVASIITADSGNGAHLLLRIDLPNDGASRTLTERCLQAISSYWSDDAVTVDLVTFNAARITKLYGTLVCKGDAMPDRPHRHSRLLDVPVSLEPAPTSAIAHLASLAPLPEPTGWKTIGGGKRDIDAWIAAYADRLPPFRTETWNGGRKWIFETCPWNSEHTNRSSFIVQLPNGAIGAGCHHNGCAGKDWRALRALVEPAVEREPKPEVEAPSGPTVPLPDLLNAIEGFLRRYVFLASNYQATAIVLWIAHTHALAAAEATPYLSVTSPDRESGKSRLFEVAELLVARPWRVISPSEAVVFRKIAAATPTLLLDEVDTIFNDKGSTHEGLRALLNAGYRRGAVIPRCVGDTMELRDFPTFCPKALAGIGDLPDTVASRSIPIRLVRKKKTEHVEPYRHRIASSQAKPIAEMLSRWGHAAVNALREQHPTPVAVLSDRAQEVWDPLLSIADMAGDGWAKRARDAAIALHAPSSSTARSWDVELLAGVRTVFLQSRATKIATTDLVHKLMDVFYVEAWARSMTMYGDPRCAGKGFASAMQRWGVEPKTVRVGTKTPKGYDLADLQPVFDRWLPSLTEAEMNDIMSTADEPNQDQI